MNKVMEEIKHKVIHSSDFQWNNYTLIVVEENGVINCTSIPGL